MGNNLEVRFMEYIDIKDAKSGTIAGYNPGLIVTEDGPRFGRVINLEDMKNSDPPLPFILHRMRIPAASQKLDLAGILMQTEDGKKWLDSLHASWGRWGTILLDFEVQAVPFEPVKYTQYVPDFMDKPYWYRPPMGIISTISQGACFLEVRPPMKWAGGTFMHNLYYKRKVVRADGITENYSITELPRQEQIPRSSGGILLGEVRETDIERSSGTPFEGGFPRTHYLELVYPTSLREAHKYNALGIQVILEKLNKRTAKASS